MNKKILFFAVLCVSLLPASLIGQSITEQSFEQIPGETVINIDRAVSGLNVLVIRDNLPWGYDITVPLLNSLGATVSTATSASMLPLDFSVFDKIIVESIQGSSFYTVMNTNMAKFETYVSNGGIFEYNCCTQGPTPILPGGVQNVYSSSLSGGHVALGHPILVGVPDPFSGDWDSHNYLTNLPADAEIITQSLPEMNPTTVIYSIGSGVVIATTLTHEIAYYYEDNGLGYFDFGYAMYPNMLDYTDGAGPAPIPVSNWAIILGVLLIGTFIVVRYRTRLA